METPKTPKKRQNDSVEADSPRKRQKRPATLKVTNLPVKATPDDLRRIFSKYGSINRATILKDWGLVQFECPVDVTEEVHLFGNKPALSSSTLEPMASPPPPQNHSKPPLVSSSPRAVKHCNDPSQRLRDRGEIPADYMVHANNLPNWEDRDRLRRAIHAAFLQYGAVEQVILHKGFANVLFVEKRAVARVLAWNGPKLGTQQLSISPCKKNQALKLSPPHLHRGKRHVERKSSTTKKPKKPVKTSLPAATECLFITSIPWYESDDEATIRRELHAVFEAFGPHDLGIGSSLEFAQVHFLEESSMQRAWHQKDHLEMRCVPLIMRKTKPKMSRRMRRDPSIVGYGMRITSQLVGIDKKVWQKQIFQLFKPFGWIQAVSCVRNFTVVRFRNARSIREVVNHAEPFRIGKATLTIRATLNWRLSTEEEDTQSELEVSAREDPEQSITTDAQNQSRVSSEIAKPLPAVDEAFHSGKDEAAPVVAPADPIPAVIEPQLHNQGSIVSDIPMEGEKSAPDDCNVVEGTYGNVFLSSWKRLPNGFGVQGCTVVPYRTLVDKLMKSAPFLYWFQSPPASGKTALGNILQEHGWKYVEADFFDQSDIHGLTPQDKFCFIDEAQHLDKQAIFLLRRLASTSVIVCASTTAAPSPYCPDCKKRSCKVCMGCWNYACSKSPCYQKKHHVDASCLLVADSPSHKLGIQSLQVTSEELEQYLELFLGQGQGLSSAATMAKAFVPLLLKHCGGLMCHIAAVLQHLSKDGFSVSVEDLPQYVRDKMMDVALLEGLFKGRFFASLESEQMLAIENLLHKGQQPQRLGPVLVRKGMLQVVDGKYEASCPLVLDIIVHNSLKGSDGVDEGECCDI